MSSQDIDLLAKFDSGEHHGHQGVEDKVRLVDNTLITIPPRSGQLSTALTGTTTAWSPKQSSGEQSFDSSRPSRQAATHMTMDQIDLVFRRCDLDHDGKLNFEEFQRFGFQMTKQLSE